jgi:D-arginine dehydrogenase
MHVDFLIIGAGIAGASAAFELSRHGRVLILEREDQPGYHSTGRSAALFTETYGNPAIRALTRASRAFYEQPPEGFAAAPMLTPRGVVIIARPDQRATFETVLGDLHRIDPAVVEISPERTAELFPIVNPDVTPFAFHEPGAMDMDVHAIHQGYLRHARARGAEVRTGIRIEAIVEAGGPSWEITTDQGRFSAPVLVNAAGAWADEVAALAGVPTIGLQPKRRTAVLIDPPQGLAIGHWCMACDLDESFYIKPDAGRLLLSPADETPTPPTDAQPEELDVALAVDRAERLTRLKVGRISHRWAGLRSFVADKTTVVGQAPGHPGFVWLAAQGGYGIQTAPAMALACAAASTGGPLPAALEAQGVALADIGPARLFAA